MPLKNKKENPFPSLFEQYRDIFTPTATGEKIDYATIFGDSPLLNQVIHHSSALLLVLDYANNEYVYVSPSIKPLYGLDPELVIKEGSKYLLANFHPEDLDILVKRVYPTIQKFYREYTGGDRQRLHFHFNYRYLHNGVYKHLLQQSCYPVHDSANVPLMNIAYITNISTYKRDNRVYLTINSHDAKGGITELTHTFFPAHEERFFTPTEKNIIKLLAAGKTDPQIAEELFISPHTLVTHKKNMFRKAEVHSLSQLIQFASGLGLV